MTSEELEQAFRELHLDDEEVRKSLADLSRQNALSHKPAYETFTASHTNDTLKVVANAELESGS